MSSRGSSLAVKVRLDSPIPLDAQLSCRAGDLLALVGPSGSGKSTLLRIIAGLNRAAVGEIQCADEIWLGGAAACNLSPQQRNVGYLPQQYGLFPHLTAMSNVTAGLGHLPASEREARAREWLEKVHLSGLAHHRPAELSGGQQQRVALARALARDPAVLLLDEPFSAVDRTTRELLIQELAELKRELSIPIIMVTHDLDEAIMLAEQMTLIDHGKTLQAGTPHEVIARPVSARAAQLMGLQNVLQAEVVSCDAGTGRIWVQSGGLRLATPHRSDLVVGQAVDCLVPNDAVRFPGLRTRQLDAGENLVTLRITSHVTLGNETKLTASVGEDRQLIHCSVPTRLAQGLNLHTGASSICVLREASLHLMTSQATS